LANHRTRYESDTEMESAAQVTNEKDRAGGVKPTLCPACEQTHLPRSARLTDPHGDTEDELALLPPLPPTPDPEVTNKAENPDSKS
ncbi:hypothetical protein TUN199_11856, partial [Pyrenophora tritici-repentis]